MNATSDSLDKLQSAETAPLEGNACATSRPSKTLSGSCTWAVGFDNSPHLTIENPRPASPSQEEDRSASRLPRRLAEIAAVRHQCGFDYTQQTLLTRGSANSTGIYSLGRHHCLAQTSHTGSDTTSAVSLDNRVHDIQHATARRETFDHILADQRLRHGLSRRCVHFAPKPMSDF